MYKNFMYKISHFLSTFTLYIFLCIHINLSHLHFAPPTNYCNNMFKSLHEPPSVIHVTVLLPSMSPYVTAPMIYPDKTLIIYNMSFFASTYY